MKCCHADPRIDYMSLLEECRRPKPEKKVKTAGATITPDKAAELTKELKYQQHQIDILVGQMKILVTAFQATQSQLPSLKPGSNSPKNKEA